MKPEVNQKKGFFTGLKEGLKAQFFSPRTLSARERGLLDQALAEENLRRMMLFSLLLVVLQFCNLMVLNYLYLPDHYKPMAFWGSLFLLVASFLLCVGAGLLMRRPTFLPKAARPLYGCFWLILLLGLIPFLYADFTVHHSLTNVILFFAVCLLLPISRMWYIITLVSLEILVVIVLLFWIQGEAYFISQTIVLGAITVVLSQLTYSRFCRTFLVNLRLQAANQALEEANATLEQLAERDSLTGLLNRRGMEKHLEILFPQCARSHMPLSFIMVDIDFFKSYNDRFGHGAGDQCLQQISRCLRETAQSYTDVCARFGGEEFFLATSCVDSSSVLALAMELRRSVEALGIQTADCSVSQNLTISVGIASVALYEDNAIAQAFREADQALYRAKNSGRNCVVWGEALYR